MPKQNGTVENTNDVQSCLGIGVLKENEWSRSQLGSDYLGP